MTAVTAETTYGDTLIADATATFHRARLVPDWGCDDVARDCFWDLAVALKRYRDLSCGIVPAWFPGMAAGPEAFSRALTTAAEYAEEAARDLEAVLPAAAEGGTK